MVVYFACFEVIYDEDFSLFPKKNYGISFSSPDFFGDPSRIVWGPWTGSRPLPLDKPGTSEPRLMVGFVSPVIITYKTIALSYNAKYIELFKL